MDANTNEKKQKTVYFLGAGFSATAGGPTQNGIIEALLEPEFSETDFKDEDRTISALASFKKFLLEELCIDIDTTEYKKIALEDVFTPIDRCLSDGKSLGKYSYNGLVKLREDLHYLMARAIQYGVGIKVNTKRRSGYIVDFAEYVNSRAKTRRDPLGYDNISVITSNWDILLDNALFKITKEASRQINKGDIPLAVVDYCCYISSIDENEDDNYIKPGLLALGHNGYNIKYLKLHGSMNWLHCPACQRLYVKFDEKIMFQDQYCKHCRKNFGFKENQESVKLKGNLLLPTFLKDMSNIQIQLVWQNAAIELSEATKIVFIGYSLPEADYEIRQLLSRFISKECEIDVFLYGNKNDKNVVEEEIRYRTFFGKRKIKTFYGTVPDYVREHCQ